MILSAEERERCDRWLGNSLAGVYQPQPHLTIWEWAEQNLIIPSSESADYGGHPWSSSITPYVRDVMEWMREFGKKEMFICKGSQCGMTMAILICICWFIVHQPTNVGYYIDSEKEARNISKTRLQRWVLDNGLLDTIGENEEDMSNLIYTFRGMTVYLHGSHTGSGYQNKSLGLAILDELDAHPHIEEKGTTADLARGRVKVPKNSKLIGFSTPTHDEGQIWKEYQSGTQEKFFVQCPHCQHMQDLTWGRVRFSHCKDLAGKYDTERVLRETYYECEMGCRIEQSEKSRLFEKCEWRATAKSKNPRKRSKQINDLYAPFDPWGVLAVEFIEKSKTKETLRTFTNERLAEAFKKESGEAKQNDVMKLRQNYQRGVIPLKPWFVLLTTDVQKETLKWTLLACMRNGDIYVIDWGEYVSWSELRERIEKPVPCEDGEEYPVLYTCVDEGDGNRNLEVRRFCLHEGEYVVPFKGRGKGQYSKTLAPSESWVDGYELVTYHVADPVYKYTLIFDRIKRKQAKKDLQNEDYKPHLYLPRPRDVDPEFMEEIVAEKLVVKEDKNGYRVENWEKTGTNDFLDCLKYGLALYDLAAATMRAWEAEEEGESA